LSFLSASASVGLDVILGEWEKKAGSSDAIEAAHEAATSEVGTSQENMLGSERIFMLVRKARYALNWIRVRRWSTERGK